MQGWGVFEESERGGVGKMVDEHKRNLFDICELLKKYSIIFVYLRNI